jgi:hypothetical protein
MLVYVVFSAFRTDNSAKVARKLEKAKLKVEALQAKLLTAENNEASRGGNKSSAKQVPPPSAASSLGTCPVPYSVAAVTGSDLDGRGVRHVPLRPHERLPPGEQLPVH